MMFNPLSSYGDVGSAGNWFDTEQQDHRKLAGDIPREKVLKQLRPSLETLTNKRALVGLEIGVGQAVNSLNILNGLNIDKLFLIDVVVPSTELAQNVINDSRVTFFHGDSLNMIDKIDRKLDFAYIDGCHEYNYMTSEIVKLLPLINPGGIIGGHDYDQIGVNLSVQTLYCNLWRNIKRKPRLFVESCRDEHPAYPFEYKEMGFPLDWWIEIPYDIKLGKSFKYNHLRNG